MRLLALLIFCLLPATQAQAAEFELDSADQVLRLQGAWRFQVGDDPRWADPAYDDGQWGSILVPGDWLSQGHKGLSGFAWYRAVIELNNVGVTSGEDYHRLGLSLGKIHSAYEVYVGGILLGGAGRLPPNPEPVYDQMRIFSIPPTAIDADGKLLIAVRVWRDEALGASSTAGLHEGDFLLGPVFELTKRVWLKQAVVLMLSISYLVFGIYHLYLYLRNRKLPEFFWFGVTACLVAVYSIELSQWKHVVGWMAALPYVLHKKIEYGTVYLLPAMGLQLLVCLLRLRLPGWARAYQGGFVVFALLALLVPGFEILTQTLFLWQAYTIPGLFGCLALVVWHSAGGNEEARTMTVGWAIFLFTALNDILVAQGTVQHPRLLTFGFAAILISMAVSLANRFSRMYNHLDGVVQQRTRELELSNEKLTEAVRLDALTGLLNRRGFADKVEEEIARSARTGRDFSVMMGDIDRFKACNDQHGHAGGDYVLKEVADLLQRRLRSVDTVARWGGEEFIFLLPETDIDGATELAEQLRGSLERTLFRYNDRVLSLTITIGVAAYESGMSMEDCVARADNALYAGKQAGRNRVVVDEQPPALASLGELPGRAI